MSYQNNENVGTVGNILEQIDATLDSTENTQPTAAQIDSQVGGRAMRAVENIPEESDFQKSFKEGLGSRTKKKDVQVASNAPLKSLIPEIHQLLKQQVKHHNYNKDSFGENNTEVTKSITPRPRNLDQTDFLKKLAMKESSNNYRADNKKGYFGLIQLGQDRITDYNKNNDTKITTKQYLNSDAIQDKVNEWHIKDIDRAYYKYPDITKNMQLNSFRAVAHLGGINGALKYAKTKSLSPNNPNKYDPSDKFKSKLSDYDSIFFNAKGTQ